LYRENFGFCLEDFLISPLRGEKSFTYTIRRNTFLDVSITLSNSFSLTDIDNSERKVIFHWVLSLMTSVYEVYSAYKLFDMEEWETKKKRNHLMSLGHYNFTPCFRLHRPKKIERGGGINKMNNVVMKA
jgi:hypothetical protein